jgi:hypothetical protein
MIASAIGTETVKHVEVLWCSVDHDVEADLVTQCKLVKVPIEQLVPNLEIVIAIGQHDAKRAALQPLLPRRVIGHFRKIPDAHGGLSF